MDRPVLKLVGIHPGDLVLQSLTDFFVGKRPAKEACHLDIAPKLTRQWQVILRPAPEPKPLTFHKISFGEHTAYRIASRIWVGTCDPVPWTRSISAPTARSFSTMPSYPRSM